MKCSDIIVIFLSVHSFPEPIHSKALNNLYKCIFFFFPKRIVVGDSDANSDSWDDVHMICPNQCVCKESPYMDLSVARWIEKLRGQNFDIERSDVSLETNEVNFVVIFSIKITKQMISLT